MFARLLAALVVLACGMVAQNPSAGNPAQRARAAYRAACMDRAQRVTRGFDPLAQDLNQIAAVVTNAQLAGPLGRLHRYGISAAFRLDDFPAPQQPPQTDNQHRAQLSALFAAAGDPPAAAAGEARAAMQLAAAWPPPHANPPRWLALPQLRALAPNLNWTAYFAALGVPISRHLPVADAMRLEAVNGSLLTAPLAEWRSYLRSRWLEASAAWLAPAPSPPLQKQCADAVAAFPPAAYATVPVRPDDFFGDTLRLRAWRVRLMLESNSSNARAALRPGGR